MTLTMVVARYKENIEWLNRIVTEPEYKHINNIIIYNKSEEPFDYLIKSDKIKILNVENRGREAGTYLDYIIENYDNLPEEIIFTQADPFIHSPNFMELLKIDSYLEYKDIQSLTCCWKYSENIPPKELVDDTNIFDINNNKIYLNLLNTEICLTEGHSKFKDPDIINIFNSLNRKFNTNNIFSYINNNIIEIKHKYINFIFCACFFVKKKKILNNKINIYRDLNNFIYYYDNQGLEESILIERLWEYLFSHKSYESLEEYYNDIIITNEDYICNYNDNGILKIIKKDTMKISKNSKNILFFKKGDDFLKIRGIEYDGDVIYKAYLPSMDECYKYYNFINKLDNNEFKITMIVARYKENIKWLNKIITEQEYKHIDNIIIYNKSDEPYDYLIKSDKIKILNVENRGREGGTYLDYIIENYNNFPNNLIFTQANPFEHSRDYMNLLKSENYYFYESYQSLTEFYNINDPNVKNDTEYSTNIYNINNNRVQNYNGDSDFLNYSYLHEVGFINQYGRNNNNILKYINERFYLEIKPDNIYKYNNSACFFTKKELIKNNSLKSYLKIKEFLYETDDQAGYSLSKIHCNQGVIVEFLWNVIFTHNTYSSFKDCYKDYIYSLNNIGNYKYNDNKLEILNYNNEYEIIENYNNVIVFEHNKKKYKIFGYEYINSELKKNIINNIDNIKSTYMYLSNINLKYKLMIRIDNLFLFNINNLYQELDELIYKYKNEYIISIYIQDIKYNKLNINNKKKIELLFNERYFDYHINVIINENLLIPPKNCIDIYKKQLDKKYSKLNFDKIILIKPSESQELYII
jgi:hypothetical protein